MNKTLMTVMTLGLATASVAVFAADAEDKLRDAAQAAGTAASEKGAEINAGAKVNNEQVKADAEAAAATSSTTVTGTIKHRAKQATHKVKAVGDKASEKYHGAMADHYTNKAAADVSSSMSTGQ